MSQQEQEDQDRLDIWLTEVQTRAPRHLADEERRYIAESRMGRAVHEGRRWLERQGGECWAKRYAEDVALLLRHIAALEGEG